MTAFTLQSEKTEQECLIQSKDEFPYDLYLIKIAGSFQWTMFSLLLPFVIPCVFGLIQAFLLTNSESPLNGAQNMLATAKNLLHDPVQRIKSK